MKTFKLAVEKREKLGKAETQKLRKKSMVPCVLYGGTENQHFFAHENSFKKLVYTPEVYIVEIDQAGKSFKAILKEIQFHPVSDKLNHIDFVEVFDDKPVTINIPIEITGSSIGVKNGGKLRQRVRSLKVKGLLVNLPEKLKVDVTNLNVGQLIKVSDVSYDKLELLDPPFTQIIGVVSSRAAAKGGVTEADAPDAAPAGEAKAE